MSKSNKTGKNNGIKVKIIFALSAVLIAGALLYVLFLGQNNNSDQLAAESSDTSTAYSTSTAASTTVTAAPSTEKPVTTAVHSTVKPTTARNGSFYDGVSYRSPTAVPADIFKHGRELMLLNNSYELPESFEWDLVYWSNGQPVDALSLNYKQYDSVKAVDRAAYKPLKDLFAAAEGAGVPLQLVSAYRSIDLQDRLFTRSVDSYINQGYSRENAIEKANYSRAFTGTSEHNTGLGFDILQKENYTLSQGFENTEQFRWLNEHASEYGFILRYREDKTDITGIMYEPWHFRYVGIEAAKEIESLDMCLEEYIEYLER